MIKVETRRNGTLTGPVNDWQRLVWRQQVNTVTGGTITLPQSSPALDELLTASASDDIGGLVISDDELVSGVGVWHLPVHVVEENLTAKDGTVTIPFRLDSALLNDNPAFPDPTNPTDPFGAAATWAATGELGLTTYQFVKAQAGQDATAPWRRFDEVVYSFIAPGPTVTYAARMQPCLDYIAAIAQGLTVINVYLRPGGIMRCHVRGIEDKPNVVFSQDLNTLVDYTWRNTMPPATDYYAGGTGTGTGRDLAIGTLDSTLWPRKRGLFIDRASSTGTDLQAAADQAAVWAGPTLELVATDGIGSRFWTDWQLGDTVRADVAGTRYVLPATAIDTEATQTTVSRRITLGAPRLDGRDAVDVRRSIISTFGLQENP